MRQEKVTIQGKEYTFQHPGARWYLEMTDRAQGRTLVLAESILEHVVVAPKLTVDDFDDDLELLEEICDRAHTFLKKKKRQS